MGTPPAGDPPPCAPAAITGDGLEVVVPASTAELLGARRRLHAWCDAVGIRTRDQADLVLVTSELLTYAISTLGPRGGRLRLVATLEDRRVDLRVTEDRSGADPPAPGDDGVAVPDVDLGADAIARHPALLAARALCDGFRVERLAAGVSIVAHRWLAARPGRGDRAMP